MLDELNKIRNSDFSVGGRKPKSWQWRQEGAGVTWRPADPPQNGDLAGAVLHSAAASATGLWTQDFRLKKNQHYRVEAVVSCVCRSDRADGGLVLSLHFPDENGAAHQPMATAPLRRAHEFTLRAYFKTPPGARVAQLRVGLENAGGSATIHDVRVLPVIEPESKSHPWALPAPPFACPPPLTAKTIHVATRDTKRPLLDLLRARFGSNAVTVSDSNGVAAAAQKANVVFLLEDAPPPKLQSLRAIEALAAQRIVILSLRCMEALSRGRLATKKIEQIDDPIHARVVYADFVTGGLALHDIIPFAGRDDHSPRMFQRQFRSNKATRTYCQEHGYHVMLDAVTDSEATSGKPIALFKRTAGGAVIVMDIEPAEAVTSSLNEPAVAMHLILAALGEAQHAVGQFVAPARGDTEFQRHLFDMVDRFPALTWVGGARPAAPNQPHMITLGRDTETLGLPVIPRPVILIRTGLADGDLLGAYGVLMWLKQLLRPAPYLSPYAKTLISRYRLIWQPRSATMSAWGGWRFDRDAECYPIDAEFEPGSIAACVDVAGTPRHRVNLVTQKRDGFHQLLAQVTPDHARRFIAGRHFYLAPPLGADGRDVTAASWRTDDLAVRVTADADGFTEDVHGAASAAGAELIRLELPATHSEPFADSIWRTDWAACMLEHVVGLLLGLVVVNRDAEPTRYPWPKPLEHLRDRAVTRRSNDPDTDLPLPRSAKGTVTIPPGGAIVADQQSPFSAL
jgi:hypothetical protein